jgi:predicted DNA-binding transcriptional regulator AlpA
MLNRIDDMPLPAMRPPIGINIPARDGDPLLGSTASAAFLGVSEKTLARHRQAGSGPVFERVGKKLVGYRRSALVAWATGSGPAEG